MNEPDSRSPFMISHGEGKPSNVLLFRVLQLPAQTEFEGNSELSVLKHLFRNVRIFPSLVYDDRGKLENSVFNDPRKWICFDYNKGNGLPKGE